MQTLKKSHGLGLGEHASAGPVNLPRPVSFPEVLGPPGCVPEQPLRIAVQTCAILQEAAEAPDDDEEPNGTLASAQHQSPETVRQEAADQVIGPEVVWCFCACGPLQQCAMGVGFCVVRSRHIRPVAPPGYADEDASDLPASKTQVKSSTSDSSKKANHKGNAHRPGISHCIVHLLPIRCRVIVDQKMNAFKLACCGNLST
eukprot:5403740-Amphidinium_carterae.1